MASQAASPPGIENAQAAQAQATQVVQPVFEDDAQQVDIALARLRKCYKTGKTRKYEFRVAQLKQLMKGLRTMAKEISKAGTDDLGKDDFSNWFLEIRGMEREIEHALDHLKTWMKDECVDTPMMLGPARSYLQREPLGVVAVLGSWNYPISTALGPVISAIAAGNCCLLKPSEMAPYTAKVVKQLFGRFLDCNAFQCVNGGVNVAIRTTTSQVDLIVYTGSTEKGRLVASAAAKNLVPCILELGGKCPVVIDESCDLNYTAKKVAAMAFLNSGQLCIRSDYALVQSSMAEKFLTKLKENMQIYYNDGTKKATLGKVINNFHHERCCKLLADHQGTMIVGNANADLDKNLTPTVILNPSLDSDVMKDEIFGPIFPVFTYKNIQEAIEFIQNIEKPLAVYYFGRNSWSNKNLMRLKEETSSGAFLVNDIAVHFLSGDMPFGGVGASGYGRCHGREGFLQCSNTKSVMVKTPLNFWPFTVIHPPFTSDKQRTIRLLMTKMDYTQMQVYKRVAWLVIIIIFIWLVGSKRLTMKKLKKVKMMFGMAFQMLKN